MWKAILAIVIGIVLWLMYFQTLGMIVIVLTIATVIALKIIKSNKNQKGDTSQWPRPGMPADFIPTHVHDNVALDAKTCRVWVRHTETGEERVFSSSEITGWGITSDTSNNSYGQTWPIKVCLEIKTKDLDKPIWKARFNRFVENRPTSKNYDNCSEWFQRLEALFNHGATGKSGVATESP